MIIICDSDPIKIESESLFENDQYFEMNSKKEKAKRRKKKRKTRKRTIIEKSYSSKEWQS